MSKHQKEPRLRWNGNLQAQKEADEAFDKLKDKPKKKKKPKRVQNKPKPKINYYNYIKSKKWYKKRQQKLNAVNNHCEICQTTHNLQVHHKHYQTLGHEKLSDLMVLCANCHQDTHLAKVFGIKIEELQSKMKFDME